MSYLNHTRTRVVAALMLLALPACTVTFRQKPIEPLDTDRNYDTTIQAAWSGIKQVIEEWPYQISEESFDADNNAGMIITDYWVLPDLGEDVDRLKEVAYAQGAPFIGGRYTLTATVREIRGGNAKVKIVARIEGYMGEEYGYQVLRSTGLIEETLFDRLSETLGTTPVED